MRSLIGSYKQQRFLDAVLASRSAHNGNHMDTTFSRIHQSIQEDVYFVSQCVSPKSDSEYSNHSPTRRRRSILVTVGFAPVLTRPATQYLVACVAYTLWSKMVHAMNRQRRVIAGGASEKYTTQHHERDLVILSTAPVQQSPPPPPTPCVLRFTSYYETIHCFQVTAVGHH